MIPYGRHTIDAQDIEAVVAALKSDHLTSGPEVDRIEAEFAERVGAKHAVAVCNGTAALHLAVLVAGIGRGDRVMTSPNTFLASANCTAFVGATPDFADIDDTTFNLCPQSLEENWSDDIKAVVAVDYAGQPANMPAIADIARTRGAVVIEDGCHALGSAFVAEHGSWNVGGHPWADMTTFSFHPVKTMTTGEGGMLVTDQPEFARRARLLRTHGMERASSRFQGSGTRDGLLAEQGPWFYEMQELGFNYRITDIQCALGRSQLRKLTGFIDRRRQIVSRYNEAFQGLPWMNTPGVGGWNRADLISWHLYTAQFDFERLGRSRSKVMETLRNQGIGTQVLYIPVYLQPWYRSTYGYGPGKCPTAEKYYTRTLSLPLYPSMSDEEVTHVIQRVKALGSET